MYNVRHEDSVLYYYYYLLILFCVAEAFDTEIQTTVHNDS